MNLPHGLNCKLLKSATTFIEVYKHFKRESLLFDKTLWINLRLKKSNCMNCNTELLWMDYLNLANFYEMNVNATPGLDNVS